MAAGLAELAAQVEVQRGLERPVGEGYAAFGIAVAAGFGVLYDDRDAHGGGMWSGFPAPLKRWR